MFLAGMVGGAAERGSQNIQAAKKREEDRKDFQNKAIFESQMQSWDEDQKLLKKLQYMPDEQKVIALGKYFGTDIEKLPSPKERERAIQEGLTLLPDIMNRMQSVKMPRYGQKPSSYQSPLSVGAQHLYNTIGVQPVPNRGAGTQAVHKFSTAAQSVIQERLDLSSGDSLAKAQAAENYLKNATAPGAKPGNYPDIDKAKEAFSYYSSVVKKAATTAYTTTNRDGTKAVHTLLGDNVISSVSIGEASSIEVDRDALANSLTLFSNGLEKRLEDSGIALHPDVKQAFAKKDLNAAVLSNLTQAAIKLKRDNEGMSDSEALFQTITALDSAVKSDENNLYKQLNLSTERVVGGKGDGAMSAKFEAISGRLPPGVEAVKPPEEAPKIPDSIRVSRNGKTVEITTPSLIEKILSNPATKKYVVSEDVPIAKNMPSSPLEEALIDGGEANTNAMDGYTPLQDDVLKERIPVEQPVPVEQSSPLEKELMDGGEIDAHVMDDAMSEYAPLREDIIKEPEGYIPPPEPEDMMPNGTEDGMYTIEELEDFKTAERFASDVVSTVEELSSDLEGASEGIKNAINDVIETVKAIPFAKDIPSEGGVNTSGKFGQGGPSGLDLQMGVEPFGEDLIPTDPVNKKGYGESGLDRFMYSIENLLDEMEFNVGYTTKEDREPEPLQNKRDYGESGLDRLDRRITRSISKMTEEFGYTPPPSRVPDKPVNKRDYRESGLDRLTLKIQELMNVVRFSNKMMGEK
jgi:hypothetical protein